MSDQIKIMLFLNNSLIKKEYLILLIVRFILNIAIGFRSL